MCEWAAPVTDVTDNEFLTGSPSDLLLMLQHPPHEGAQRGELCPLPVRMTLFTGFVISADKENCPVRFPAVQAQGHS